MIFLVMTLFIVFTMLFHYKDKNTFVNSVALAGLLVPAWILVGKVAMIIIEYTF